jgi:hypothetical protein
VITLSSAQTVAHGTITLEITHPLQSDGRMSGFRYLWAFQVNGYRSDRHCQQCFYGRLVPQFSPIADVVSVGISIAMSARFPFAYICGVASGPIAERRSRNLHLPLRYADGATARLTTYNGYTISAANAEVITIPALPDDWHGLRKGHARCKNFQFAVAQFGYPSVPRRSRSIPSPADVSSSNA